MTRNWTFTLANANQSYNLWNDLIANTDPTFSNSQFVPSMVCEFEIQNQTAGATVLRDGFVLSSGSWDIRRTDRNTIPLKSMNLQSDTAGTVIYVSITAN
jgi:hypothetical protein